MPLAPRALDRAIEFLLGHWVTREPLGPCTFGIGARFLRVEYPLLRYNLFYYVHVLSHYAAARADGRFHEALRELSVHVGDDGVILDNPHRAWRSFAFARPGQASELATKRWHEIVRNTD